MKNFSRINNWDLIDLSSPNIVGDFTFFNPDFKEKIFEFVNSENLWKKRIGVLSTFYFIREKNFDEAIKIAEILLEDKHDLIQKAVGWMLREIGKREEKILEIFLEKHRKKMPRTMLRYAIEKFSEEKRKKFLKK